MAKVIYWNPDKGTLELTADDIIALGPFDTLMIKALTSESIETETLEASESVTAPLVNAGYVAASVAAALTATGTDRDDALQLAAAVNLMGTVAAGTGVVLPAAEIGTTVLVFNGGANELKVYAAGSATIDGVAGATGVPLTEALRAAFVVVAEGVWVSYQLGAVSA